MERYLQHHGVKGQKWGVRRYQNPDGSVTAAGKKRYNSDTNNYDTNRDILDSSYEFNLSFGNTKKYKEIEKRIDDALNKNNADEVDEAWKELEIETGKYTANKLLKKYGEERFRDHVAFLYKNDEAYKKELKELIDYYSRL